MEHHSYTCHCCSLGLTQFSIMIGVPIFYADFLDIGIGKQNVIYSHGTLCCERENVGSSVFFTFLLADNLIIVGLGGCVIFKDDPKAINIRVYADEKTRIDRLTRRYNIDEEEAESSIAIGDRKHKRFVSILYDQDLASPDLYDMTLSTDRMSVEECADAVIALATKHDLRLKISRETESNNSIDHQTSTVVFKNPTEEEFARILDMYNIEWMYEPKTFPIEWDSEGNIKMAFSPDFYLPKFDIYLELTTMEQKYVTKKNKKARMVMELYPGTNVRIVYKKDFLALAERFKQFGG